VSVVRFTGPNGPVELKFRHTSLVKRVGERAWLLYHPLDPSRAELTSRQPDFSGQILGALVGLCLVGLGVVVTLAAALSSR
jgi:hypothetical protein